MNRKRFKGAASAALMIVIATTLVLASGAWAQSKYKTLYKFKGGTGGSCSRAGLSSRCKWQPLRQWNPRWRQPQSGYWFVDANRDWLVADCALQLCRRR